MACGGARWQSPRARGGTASRHHAPSKGFASRLATKPDPSVAGCGMPAVSLLPTGSAWRDRFLWVCERVCVGVPNVQSTRCVGVWFHCCACATVPVTCGVERWAMSGGAPGGPFWSEGGGREEGRKGGAGAGGIWSVLTQARCDCGRMGPHTASPLDRRVANETMTSSALRRILLVVRAAAVAAFVAPPLASPLPRTPNARGRTCWPPRAPRRRRHHMWRPAIARPADHDQLNGRGSSRHPYGR